MWQGLLKSTSLPGGCQDLLVPGTQPSWPLEHASSSPDKRESQAADDSLLLLIVHNVYFIPFQMARELQ
jgi:hypothetical protein